MPTVRKLGLGDDIEMMKTPDHWPHRTLPLKRTPASLPEGNAARMGNSDLGFLTMGNGPKVYLGNIFMPTNEIIAYDDFEAIHDAGWRVD